MDDNIRLMEALNTVIVCLTIYLADCVLMLLAGLSMQTVTRFPDEKLGKLTDGSKKARRIAGLQKSSDVLRFRVLTVQMFCGMAVTVIMVVTAIAAPFHSLLHILYKTNLDISADIFALYLWLLLIALYSALCTELPRRAAKTGVLSGERGEKFALATVNYLMFLLIVFKPVTLVSELFLKAFGAMFGVRPEITDETSEDLIQLIDAQGENGGIEEEQAEMISNIFEFSDLELHDVMTHRTEICAAEIGARVAEVVGMAVETGFSRIPVYRDSIDDICGVIYIKDLLPLILAHDAGDIPAAKYIHKIKYVPESGSCGELFTYFTENKRQIAVVLDEYGGTAGIVTMEDLLESIVGNIRDEYDAGEEEEIQEITPHTFDLMGSADPEEVMERLGRKLDGAEDFDTMGGYVTELLGFIPEEGQTPAVRRNGITFGVISAKDNHIAKIRAVIDKDELENDDNEK